MKRKSPSKVKRVLYVFLSFILSFVMFLMSFAVLLELTVFNKEFIFGEMNKVGYFDIQRMEISRNLKDLGYASGLDESFFDELIDDSMLREDTAEYLDSFYSGTGSVIRLDNFKQKFNSAIDVYIEKEEINPASVSAESRKYLVDNAASIYRESLQIPFIKYIAGYFLGIKNALPAVIGVTGLMVLFLCVIFIFSTKWKHRAVRYICYATLTTFLAMLAPFIAMISTGTMKKLNISSKAFYDFFVAVNDSVMMYFLYFAIFFALLSLALFILFKRLYPKKESPMMA